MLPPMMPPPAGTHEKMKKLVEQLNALPLPVAAGAEAPVVPGAPLPEPTRDEFIQHGPPCSPVTI